MLQQHYGLLTLVWPMDSGLLKIHTARARSQHSEIPFGRERGDLQ